MDSFLAHWGYLAVFVLTVAESACIPIPSEVTLGLGGALASGVSLSGVSTPQHLNLLALIVVGTVGSVVGSYLAYAVGRTGGRAFVDRFGKYLLLTHKDLDWSEDWFSRRGEATVLVGRVLPVVRTFVSFPAGMAEMNLLRFGMFTTIGAAVWVTALSSMGYALGSSYHSMVKGFGDATYVAAAVVVVAIVVVVVHRIRVVRAESAQRAGAAEARSPSR